MAVSSENAKPESFEELAAKLISVTEASQLSGLTTRHIRRLIGSGEIKGIKVGRNWLTTEKAVREYLKKDRRPGPKSL